MERKRIGNERFYYLTEQVRIGKRYRKIQVYVGKHIPKDPARFYIALGEKEKDLVEEHLSFMFALGGELSRPEYVQIERARIDFKYFFAQLSPMRAKRFWRAFAIRFIFESNAIEGSKLSESEVSAIVRNERTLKKLDRREVREAQNSIVAFDIVMGKDFSLNQRSIVGLHAMVVAELGVPSGFKRRKIVVNKKQTVLPGQVRSSLASLMRWWKAHTQAREHPLLMAAQFHQRFERIHPFEDGNGRVGRLLFVWMLARKGYGPILFRHRNRRAYFSALNHADDGRSASWMHQVADVYVRTIRESFSL